MVKRPLSCSALARSPSPRSGLWSGTPAEILSQLKARDIRHIYVDGGITIQRFLQDGLIQRLVITRVPVLIGTGIPLFGPVPRDIVLRHV
jgi:riboflavin biosynthesis pyrimidine reductase